MVETGNFDYNRIRSTDEKASNCRGGKHMRKQGKHSLQQKLALVFAAIIVCIMLITIDITCQNGEYGSSDDL